jgi:hypothetical protein
MAPTLEECIQALPKHTMVVFNHPCNLIIGGTVRVEGIPPSLLVALKTSRGIMSINFCHWVGAEECLAMLAHGEFPLIKNLIVSHHLQPKGIAVDIAPVCALLKSPLSSIRYVMVNLVLHKSIETRYIGALYNALEDPCCKIEDGRCGYIMPAGFKACIKKRQIRNTMNQLSLKLSRDMLRELEFYLL